MILNKKQKINSAIIGTDCNLSLIGTFQIIQDAITEMMGLNKIDGITVKQNYNAVWVFTKTRAKIFAKAPWNSEISITCYISNISAIRMYADVEIQNNKGEMIMHSRTEMCALDIATQRIKKISALGVTNSMVASTASDDIVFTKFDDIDMPVIEKLQVRSSNIDFVHHTNNLEYIRFIINTYTVAQLESNPIKEIEILYISQSFENDILGIKKASQDDKDIFVIDKDNQPVVKCEIVYCK